MNKRLLLLPAAAIALCGGAAAQTPEQPYYNVHEINFDMWCQEQQHLPPSRCDKRLPQDDAAYQAYVNKIQQYEIPYLQQRERDRQLNQGIIHYDPIDNTRPNEPHPVPAQPGPPPGG